LACAKASASVGLDLDLLLTSTTCNGWEKWDALSGLGSTSAMPNNRKACNAIEEVIATDNGVNLINDKAASIRALGLVSKLHLL